MGATQRVRVVEVDGGVAREREDQLAVEEPLEIRVESPDGPFPLAVTMRTPGHDLELAAGFLFSEGVITAPDDVRSLRHCVQVPVEQRENTVTAALSPHRVLAATAMVRRFTVSSACGVCGLSDLDALADRGVAPVRPVPVSPAAVLAMPALLSSGQRAFDRTGGLHAAGLVSPSGELLCVREDVGRHNALDKVVGWALLQGLLPLHGHRVAVSGRTSFELVQKTVCAGAGLLAGVSAPSSLAVSLARRFDLSLVGFVRGSRCVVYAGALSAGD